MLKRLLRKSDKAFTLVEILLAVALLAIATVAIGGIIISTQNSTTQMFSESELQQQLVEVQQTLHNELLMANEGIKYWSRDSADDYFKITTENSSSAYEKLVAFYSLDSKSYELTKKYYRWNSEKQTLYVATIVEPLIKDQINDVTWTGDDDISAVMNEIGNSWTVVASAMNRFDIGLSDYGQNRLVTLNLSVEQEEITYPSDDVVYIRNKIDVNQDIVIEKYHNMQIEIPTITNTEFVYNQQVHAPTEINFLDRYVERVDSETTLSAINAGTYTITYRLIDKEGTHWAGPEKSTADIKYTWRIEPAVVTLTWGETEWVYDGISHGTTCSVGGVYSGDDPQLSLINNSVGPDVGTSDCTATFLNTNYTAPTLDTVTLKILPVSASAEITLNHGQVYDGTKKTLAGASKVYGGTVKFHVSKLNETPSSCESATAQAIEAGTYHVWYQIDANDSVNYGTSEVTYVGAVEILRSKTAKANAITPSPVFTGNAITGVSGDGVAWGGTMSAINCGTYTAIAKPTSNYLWPDGSDEYREIEWSIQPVDVTIVPPSALSLIYNGSNQELVRAGYSPSDLPGTMMYKLGVDGTWSASIPQAKNVGTYVVYYYFESHELNYKSTDKNASVVATIDPSPSAYMIGKTLTYTGEGQIGIDSAFVTFTNGCDEAVDVGVYVMYGKPMDNYSWADTNTTEERGVQWYINKAQGAIDKDPRALTLVYDGTAQTLIAAGTTRSGTLYYKLSTETEWSTSLPKATNAGIYTVEYFVQGSGNFHNSEVRTLEVEIQKRPAATIYGYSVIYDATAQTGYAHEYVKDILGTKASTSVGTYTVSAVPDDNYCWSDTKTTERRTVTWYITKKIAGFAEYATAIDGLVYNGTAQQLINEAIPATIAPHSSIPCGEVVYSVNGGQFTKYIPTGINAGTYEIEYYIHGNEDHSDSEKYTITATIERSPSATVGCIDHDYDGLSHDGIDVLQNAVVVSGTRYATEVGEYSIVVKPKDNYSWVITGTTEERTVKWNILPIGGIIDPLPTAADLTYNGSAQTLLSDGGSSSTGTMMYKLGADGTYSTAIPKATNAGTYVVYYYSKGTGKFFDSEEKYISVTIKPLATAYCVGGEVEYNGGITGQSGFDGEHIDIVDGDIDGVNAGEYKVYVVPSANYAWSDTGTTERREVTWYIRPLALANAYGGTYQYTGDVIQGVRGEYFEVIAGEDCATDPGEWGAYVQPLPNYAWADDGTTDGRSVVYWITGVPDATYYSQTLTYNGSTQYGVFGENIYVVSGSVSDKNAGVYTAVIKPEYGHLWEDLGTDEQITVKWEIKRAAEATVSSNGSFTFNAATRTGVTGKNVTLSGDVTAVNAGSYTAVAVPTANYCWKDTGTVEPRTVTWKILPSPTATFTTSDHTYDGAEHTGVSLTNATIVSGSTTQRDAGTYTVYVKPQTNYCWANTTDDTSQKELTFTISYRAWAKKDKCMIIQGIGAVWNSTGNAVQSRYYTTQMYVMKVEANNILVITSDSTLSASTGRIHMKYVRYGTK